MMKIFFEDILASFTVLMTICFLKNIKIKPKMFIWLSSIYILLFPSLLIPEANNVYVGTAFKIIYMICPIFIASLAFGLSEFKSILYTYFIYFGAMSYLFNLLTLVSSLYMIEAEVLNTVDVSMYIIVLILTVFLYCKRYKYEKLRGIALISNKLKILALISLWVSSLFCEFIRRAIVPMEHTKTIIGIIVLSIMLATLMGILWPIMIIYSFSRDKYKIISKINETQAKAQVNRYELMQEANEDIRKFRHDCGNLHIGLKSLLKQNKIDEALKAINFYDKSIYLESRGLYNTNNYIVDALLQEKQNWSTRSNTIIKFKGVIPPNNIDMEDLCIMFGVTLDNAIEACEKLDINKEKVITVSAEPIRSCLFIIIKNPVSDNVEINNNHVKTIKDDRLNHGMGLYSLRKSLEKYCGDIEISCYDNIFRVKLSLFFR